MKKILLLLLVFMVLLGGCSSATEQTEEMLLQAYSSDNGYKLELPADWLLSSETVDKTEFADSENQLYLSITSELGGVDYFAMSEIRDQLSKKIAEQVLVGGYEISSEEAETNYFRQVLVGADSDDATIVVDIFGVQPYNTMRHYLVVIASQDAYEKYQYEIDKMVSSFTITFNEEEYLKLMDERRAAVVEDAENEAEQPSE